MATTKQIKINFEEPEEARITNILEQIKNGKNCKLRSQVN